MGDLLGWGSSWEYRVLWAFGLLLRLLLFSPVAVAGAVSAPEVYRCGPHLLGSLTPQQASDGALPSFLTGQAARRRPWKAAAQQTLRGWPDAIQMRPRMRVTSVRPASPATCTWPQPREPIPGAATCLPGCLSKAQSGESPPSVVWARGGAGAGSRVQAASPGLPENWVGVLSSDGGVGARVWLLGLRAVSYTHLTLPTSLRV